jgi:two-component system NtrC family sensor kinase
MQNPYAAMKRLILACMIVCPAIPFALTLVIGYFYFNASLESNTKQSMRRIVSDHGRMIDTFLRERRSDLLFILQTYHYEDLCRPGVLADIFQRLGQESKAFIDLGVVNEAGDHVAYRGPFALEKKNYKQTDWFRRVMEKGVYISDVFLGYRQVPHFVMALLRESGGKKWILRATIDTKTFNDMVEAVRIGKTGEAYIVNTFGLYQTEGQTGGQLMEKDVNYSQYPAPSQAARTFILQDPAQKNFLYATMTLKEKNWLLVVRQEKEDAFHALFSATKQILIIAAIGGVFIILIAFSLSSYLVRKMEKIDREKGALGQQLVRASRLAELGEMSAGFAHEINNPLQIMKSEIALIQMVWRDITLEHALPGDENTAQLADCLDQIQLQINRCGQITQGILKFGRQSEPTPQPIHLNEFIPEIIGMVNKQAMVNNIQISHIIDEAAPEIFGDPGQLQQVLLNLLNNAMHAIREAHEADGGQIRIEAQPAENGLVRLTIRDNGCGIGEENKKRVFSPFFTTKPVGKGTGLGLSVCYGIIESMGGTMDFWSETGKGTAFFLNLPTPRATAGATMV